MTEKTFTELVNLYLDNEISERGLASLKAELARNTERKAEFAERCRLHQAMRLALNPTVSKRSRTKSTRSSGRASGQPSGQISSRCAGFEPRAIQGKRRVASASTRVVEGVDRVTNFPRWIMGTGLAACLALGFTLLTPVFRDTTDAASQPKLTGVDAEELVEQDPLDSIGREELRRFASIQEQREANRRASIAAQLRLMGLRPEFTPEETQLRSLSAAAAQRPQPTQNHAELLAEVQKITPMPTQQILRFEPAQVEPAVRWPSGFQSSLANFR